jgi:hypothetical protein
MFELDRAITPHPPYIGFTFCMEKIRSESEQGRANPALIRLAFDYGKRYEIYKIFAVVKESSLTKAEEEANLVWAPSKLRKKSYINLNNPCKIDE